MVFFAKKYNMRTLKLLSAFLLVASCHVSLFSQACEVSNAFEILDVNNIRVGLPVEGSLWTDNSNYIFEVPKDNPVPQLMLGGIWIAGKDNAGNLKIAAQAHGVSSGTSDFWAGPLVVSGPNVGTTSTASCSNFSRLWKVERFEIDAHVTDWQDNGQIDGPVPQSIFAWPGKLNPESPSANGFVLPDQPLAPFVDRNANGIYEPLLGDFPDVKGDQAVWWVFNDEGAGAIHDQTEGYALHVEIQATAFAFKGDGSPHLNNTVFYEYKIINRTTEPLDSTYISLWVDMDLGYYPDDMFGSIPAEKLAFLFNNDGVTSEGDTLPIIGIKVLEGPTGTNGQDVGFSSLTYYNSPSFGNPQPDINTTAPNYDIEYYNYMTGRWKFGQPFCYGGSGFSPACVPTNHVFPDNPSEPAPACSMCTANLPAYDRRVLINSGPFNLASGESNSISYAVMANFEVEYPCPDITPLIEQALAVQEVANNQFTATHEKASPAAALQFSPNPLSGTGLLRIQQPDLFFEKVELHTLDGRLVRRYDGLSANALLVEREGLAPALYFLTAQLSNGQVGTVKVVVQ